MTRTQQPTITTRFLLLFGSVHLLVGILSEIPLPEAAPYLLGSMGAYCLLRLVGNSGLPRGVRWILLTVFVATTFFCLGKVLGFSIGYYSLIIGGLMALVFVQVSAKGGAAHAVQTGAAADAPQRARG